MKKIAFIISALTLSACSGLDAEPAPKIANLKHICIRSDASDLNGSSVIADAFKNSLQKRGITSEIYSDKEAPAKCTYSLTYNFKTARKLIKRGSVVLTNNDSKMRVGYVGYALRGDNQDVAKVSGLQGQADFMISELLKNQ
jgi:lipoprotein